MITAMIISDTIMELIPQAILEGVPQEKRAHVSTKIVKFVKDLNLELSERVERSESLDGELKALLPYFPTRLVFRVSDPKDSKMLLKSEAAFWELNGSGEMVLYDNGIISQCKVCNQQSKNICKCYRYVIYLYS